LGEAEVKNVKKKFGLDPELTFNVPDEVRSLYDHTEAGAKEVGAINPIYPVS